MKNLNLDRRIVYFIRAGEFIKIGLSSWRTFGNRLHTMRTACPFEMEVIGTCDGNAPYEKELHRRFSDCRVRAEWFRANSELLEFIAELSQAHDAEDARKFATAFLVSTSTKGAA